MAKVDLSLLRIHGTGLISLAPFSAMFVPMTRTATWIEDPAVKVRLSRRRSDSVQDRRRLRDQIDPAGNGA